MAQVILDIEQWGDSLAVRLPRDVALAAHLRADQRVCVSVEEGRMIIKSAADPSLSLEQRLSLYDPVRHGGEQYI